MFNILQTEIQKLKGSKMLWMILVGAGVPSFLDLMIAFHARGSGMEVDFPMLFSNAQMLLLLMMGPALFALFSGFLIAGSIRIEP